MGQSSNGQNGYQRPGILKPVKGPSGGRNGSLVN
jgi:hypothetical protein